jgi:hypothetical protein
LTTPLTKGEAILIERIKPKRWTPTEDAELVRLAKSGVSEPDIARQLGRSIIATIQRTTRLKTKRYLPPTSTQRQFMQRLRTDKWRRLLSVSAPAGNRLLVGMIENGWIERRGIEPDQEVRLTPAGLEALRATLRTF